MPALWGTEDTLRGSRLNRHALRSLLSIPTYDVDNDSIVRVLPVAIDGQGLATGEVVHYTAAAGCQVALVSSLTLTNNDSGTNRATLHAVPAAGSRTVANTIFDGDLLAGQTVRLRGAWGIGPLASVRSTSSTASAFEVALVGTALEITGAIAGASIVAGVPTALTTSLVQHVACPLTLVQHSHAWLSFCNTHTATVTVTVEVIPAGGGSSPAQYLLAAPMLTKTTLHLGGPDDPIVLEAGDSIWVKASTGGVVGFLATEVEYATT